MRSCAKIWKSQENLGFQWLECYFRSLETSVSFLENVISFTNKEIPKENKISFLRVS